MRLLIITFLCALLAGCTNPNNITRQEINQYNCQNEYSWEIYRSTTRYLVPVVGEYNGERIRVLTDSYSLANVLDTTGNAKDSAKLERILAGKEMVKLNTGHIDNLELIRPWKRVDSLASLGKEAVIKQFLRKTTIGYIQKEGIELSNSERAYLISLLTKWCYLVWINDESGFLLVSDVESLKKRKKRSE